MLPPPKKTYFANNYYYPSKIETKFNLVQLYWKFCLPFIFVNENLLETKQPRQCFTWNKFTASQRKQTKHTYPTFIASRTLRQHPSATKPTVCKLKYLPPHFSFKITSEISILFHMKHSQYKRAKTRQLFHVKH